MAESYETREIWTDGRRGSPACVTATIYPHTIIATADAETITPNQMYKAMKREFPRHTFYYHSDGDYLRFDAGRWTGDGLDPLRWCDTCDCFAVDEICPECNKPTRRL